MSTDWRSALSRPAAPARIADISRYVAGPARLSNSAIDSFFEASTTILRAADPTFLNTHAAMGPLMLVGLVSATENYFRDVFAAVLSFCPVAQAASSTQTVNLGTVMWHAGRVPERGAFERLSFASAENIQNTSKNFLAYSFTSRGATDASLKEFDRVCELRHGIVHSGGVLAGKNALKLQVMAPPLSRCSVGFAELQEGAAVCTTLVVAANAELFGAMCKRWAIEWRQHRSWDPTKKRQRFRAIWTAFRSEYDLEGGLVTNPIGPVRCRNLVQKEFRID
jgi:hypothetical protein